MRYFIVIIFVLSSIVLTSFDLSKEKPYKVSDIPEELQEDAVAVVRSSEVVFEIQSNSRAQKHTSYAVTILDENGDAFANFNVWYDKFKSISNIKIIIYDKEGNIIERVKSSDIKDYSSFSNYSIYEDNRQKVYVPNIKLYPFTIEISYDQDYNGLFVYPTWQPINAYDLSVEKSSFKVICPDKFNYRTFERNLLLDPDSSTESNKNIKEWKLANHPAVDREQHSPYLFEFTPIVYTAPCDFKIDGFEGNMETWQSLGDWAFKLLEGRSEISTETRDKVLAMVKDVKSKRDRIRIIYEYVQANTRYVSIQEGIGGWQPMPAIEVDELGYGDCKALSNFTMSLLKEAGIEAFYTKVRAGNNVPDMNENFVSNQSNHIILCVPNESDTIWLECTSQISPFGYIGNFTDDRNVLILTPDGGKLVRTRKYSIGENRQICTANVNLSDNAKSNAQINCTYSGLQYDNVSSLLRMSAIDREKWLLNNVDIENFKLNSFLIEAVPGKYVVPEVATKLDIEIADYASGNGDRLFVPLNLMNETDYVPPRYRNRKRDLILRYQFTDIDSIRYTLPDGYAIESCPEGCDIKSEFGEYSCSIIVESNEVLYVRKRIMYEGKYPSSAYTEFRQFYTDISKKDGGQLVLKSKD